MILSVVFTLSNACLRGFKTVDPSCPVSAGLNVRGRDKNLWQQSNSITQLPAGPQEKWSRRWLWSSLLKDLSFSNFLKRAESVPIVMETEQLHHSLVIKVRCIKFFCGQFPFSFSVDHLCCVWLAGCRICGDNSARGERASVHFL